MAKGTRVTQQEKEKMWHLYMKIGSFAVVAKKMNRSPQTVSRYVHEMEAVYAAVSYVTNAKD